MAVRKTRVRATAFTKTRRAVFLDRLAATSNVTAACRAAKVSTQIVYRARQADAAFRAQWTAALCEGYAALELAALERAIKGTVRVVKAPGGATTQVRDYSDRLALGLLTLHRKTVEEARAAERGTHADDVGEGGRSDPVEALLAQLDAMAVRLGNGEAGGTNDDED